MFKAMDRHGDPKRNCEHSVSQKNCELQAYTKETVSRALAVGGVEQRYEVATHSVQVPDSYQYTVTGVNSYLGLVRNGFSFTRSSQ